MSLLSVLAICCVVGHRALVYGPTIESSDQALVLCCFPALNSGCFVISPNLAEAAAKVPTPMILKPVIS